MSSRKGLPGVVKNMKDNEINSSLFMWKNDSPRMVVSCCLIKKKNDMCNRSRCLPRGTRERKTRYNRFLQHSTMWGRHRQRNG